MSARHPAASLDVVTRCCCCCCCCCLVLSLAPRLPPGFRPRETGLERLPYWRFVSGGLWEDICVCMVFGEGKARQRIASCAHTSNYMCMLGTASPSSTPPRLRDPTDPFEGWLLSAYPSPRLGARWHLGTCSDAITFRWFRPSVPCSTSQSRACVCLRTERFIRKISRESWRRNRRRLKARRPRNGPT